eukprot:jgi/Bigna1/80398/fgenesh1_pg.70_\
MPHTYQTTSVELKTPSTYTAYASPRANANSVGTYKKTNPKVVIGIAVLFAIIAIISMALSIAAFTEWKETAEEFNDIVDNYTLSPGRVQPIVNISVEAVCPPGLPNLAYCQELSPPAQNCTDSFVVRTNIEMANWKGNMTICVLRDGPNALDRPLTCDGNFRDCSPGNDVGPICWPMDLPCPIMQVSNTMGDTGTWETLVLGDGDSQLFFSRDVPQGRPFLQWNTGEEQVCRNNINRNSRADRPWNLGDGFMVGYDSNLNLGPGLSQFLVLIQSISVHPYWRNMHETQPCETDPRFLEIDSNLENQFLDDNGGDLPPLSAEFPCAVDSDVATWKLYNRPEILWRSSCQFERSDLADAQSSVNKFEAIVDEITRATLALMIISIFATIFDLITTVWVVRTQLDDDPTNDHSAEGWQKLGKTSCITANIITTIGISYST